MKLQLHYRGFRKRNSLIAQDRRDPVIIASFLMGSLTNQKNVCQYIAAKASGAENSAQPYRRILPQLGLKVFMFIYMLILA
jgi:hypothetical protein